MHRIDTALIDQYQTSGLTQKAFCTQHNIPISTFQYYLRKRKAKPSDSAGNFLHLIGTGGSRKVMYDTSTIMVIHGKFTISEIADIITAGLR